MVQKEDRRDDSSSNELSLVHELSVFLSPLSYMYFSLDVCFVHEWRAWFRIQGYFLTFSLLLPIYIVGMWAVLFLNPVHIYMYDANHFQ